MAVQIPLGLKEYPRPIAWTLSEVERATGYRDRAGMLFTAYEEVTRFLVWMQLARYGEYWREGKRDESVDRHVAALRRPSFGHYAQALLALDSCLESHGDPFAVGLRRPMQGPATQALLESTSRKPLPKNIALHMLLSKVVNLRNREKGHGYSVENQARSLTEALEPAFHEYLDLAPQLVERPLVAIEHIEFIDNERSVITYFRLMGTRRASKHQTEVRSPGVFRRGSLFMWDEERAPLQLSPFVHLERGPHDEEVFVLAGFAGEPSYQTRGGTVATKRPDRLIEQFEQRAPFLLEADGGVTVPRRPDGENVYKTAVELALVDGRVTAAEAYKLDTIRRDLGLTEADATAVHRGLGWDDALAERDDARSRLEDVSLRDFLSRIRGRIDAMESELDDEVEINRGELWLPLGSSHGISIWYPRKRGDQVQIAVGFYSRRKRRDPAYRTARERIQEVPAALPAGWKRWTAQSRAERLAWETRRTLSQEELADERLADEVSRLAKELLHVAGAALRVEARVEGDTEQARHGDLVPLLGKPRILGSVWIPRILWALEWASRKQAPPMSAADIARVLCENGVEVPPTNTARAFRTERDDPRLAGLCDEVASQRYVINARGRAALLRLLSNPQPS